MNKSFEDVRIQLQSEGIKNNDFMMRLDNKDLIGIDPWNKRLSKKNKELIIEECKNNFWYFVREVLRVKLDDKDATSNIVSKLIKNEQILRI